MKGSSESSLHESRKGTRHADNFANHRPAPVDRCPTDLALQHRMGYYPSGGLGLILLILLILALMGRL
jgi:hypothetical protein